MRPDELLTARDNGAHAAARAPWRWRFPLLLLVLVACWGSHRYQVAHPGCCDMVGYQAMADLFARAEGVVATPYSDRRTYGYPIFVSWVMRFGPTHWLPIASLLSLAQTLLYVGVAFGFARAVGRIASAPVASLVLVASWGNVFAYPYLTIGLTDGFSLTVQMALAWSLLEVFAAGARPAPALGRLLIAGAAAGFLWGFSVMVRPGNLHLAAPVCVAFALTAFGLRRQERPSAWLAWLLAATAGGFSVAVLPQVLSNIELFGRFTFLPVFDFGGMQTKFGQEYLKYATHMVGGAGAPLPYLSPWAASADGTLGWYLRQPVAGLVTLAAHVFGALDFDYYFPYIHDPEPATRWLLFLGSATVVYWGCVGSIALVRRARVDGPASLSMFVVLVAGAHVVGWLAVHAVTAVENRFALPVMGLALPFALVALRDAVSDGWRARAWSWSGWLLYLALAASASSWLWSLREFR